MTSSDQMIRHQLKKVTWFRISWSRDCSKGGRGPNLSIKVGDDVIHSGVRWLIAPVMTSSILFFCFANRNHTKLRGRYLFGHRSHITFVWDHITTHVSLNNNYKNSRKLVTSSDTDESFGWISRWVTAINESSQVGGDESSFAFGWQRRWREEGVGSFYTVM